MAVPGVRADTGRMDGCCRREAYQTTFSDRFARRLARRYRRRGLNRQQERLVGFLADRGIQGATVLEVGGGVGDLQVELLRRGAATATNLEISTNYEDEARRLLEESGLTGLVTRRILDIATAPDEVEPADVVVLHRVVCCYPDYERLLAAAGSHARRLLVFSHPPRNRFTRFALACDNLVRRVQRSDFRAYLHPPRGMVEVLQAQGLAPRYRHRGVVWDVVGLERLASPDDRNATADQRAHPGPG